MIIRWPWKRNPMPKGYIVWDYTNDQWYVVNSMGRRTGLSGKRIQDVKKLAEDAGWDLS